MPEKNLRRRRAFRLLCAACVLATLLLIFFNSLKTGEESKALSEAAAGTIWQNPEPEPEEMTGLQSLIWRLFSGSAQQISPLELFLRKLAHFAEFAVLGFWLQLLLCGFTMHPARYLGWPLFGGLAAAAADESIRLFVPGRSGEVRDILIDFSGVLSGILTAALLVLLVKKLVKRKYGTPQ